jgi:hypothetical protein
MDAGAARRRPLARREGRGLGLGKTLEGLAGAGVHGLAKKIEELVEKK